MDIASVVGLIGALALIVMAMGDPGPFVDTASILIVSSWPPQPERFS